MDAFTWASPCSKPEGFVGGAEMGVICLQTPAFIRCNLLHITTQRILRNTSEEPFYTVKHTFDNLVRGISALHGA